VLTKDTPSPPGFVPAAPAAANALFKTAAAFTCLVFAIERARALVYLADNLSYRLSSTASSVIEKANAIVSCVYLAVKTSFAVSNATPAPSFLTGAPAKPANITSSSNARSEDSESKISLSSLS